MMLIQQPETTLSGASSLEPTLLEVVPVVCDVYEVTPSVDRVQEGVRMLINSLSLIGSIDELAMNHECLEQLRPHFMTLEMLASVAASSPCPPRKTYC